MNRTGDKPLLVKVEKPGAVANYDDLVHAAVNAQNKKARVLATKTNPAPFVRSGPVKILDRLNRTYAGEKKYGRRAVRDTVTERVDEFVRSLAGVRDENRKTIRDKLVQSIFKKDSPEAKSGHAYRAEDIIKFAERFKEGTREDPKTDIRATVERLLNALGDSGLTTKERSAVRESLFYLEIEIESASASGHHEQLNKLAGEVNEIERRLATEGAPTNASSKAKPEKTVQFAKKQKVKNFRHAKGRAGREAMVDPEERSKSVERLLRSIDNSGLTTNEKSKARQILGKFQRAIDQAKDDNKQLKKLTVKMNRYEAGLEEEGAMPSAADPEELSVLLRRLRQDVDDSGLTEQEKLEAQDALDALHDEIGPAAEDDAELSRLAQTAKRYRRELAGHSAVAALSHQLSESVNSLLQSIDESALTEEEKAQTRVSLPKLQGQIGQARGDPAKLRDLAALTKKYENIFAQRRAQANAGSSVTS